MPFVSQKQRRYFRHMMANAPTDEEKAKFAEMTHEFDAETPKGKKLPKYVKGSEAKKKRDEGRKRRTVRRVASSLS